MTTKSASRSFVALHETDPVTPGDDHSSLYYTGHRGDLTPGPQSFLVNCWAGREFETHFHPVDQFQLFYGVEGATYQRREVPPLLLQYADAYKVYGPIVATDREMRFLTLRAEPTDLYGVMPGSRDRMLYRGRRHISVDISDKLAWEIPTAGAVEIDPVIAPEEDGLAAYSVLVGARSAVELPLGGATNRHVVVIDGNVFEGDREYGSRSVGWLPADEPPPVLRSGATGCNLLVVHYPSPPTQTRFRPEQG